MIKRYPDRILLDLGSIALSWWYTSKESPARIIRLEGPYHGIYAKLRHLELYVIGPRKKHE